MIFPEIMRSNETLTFEMRINVQPIPIALFSQIVETIASLAFSIFSMISSFWISVIEGIFILPALLIFGPTTPEFFAEKGRTFLTEQILPTISDGRARQIALVVKIDEKNVGTYTQNLPASPWLRNSNDAHRFCREATRGLESILRTQSSLTKNSTMELTVLDAASESSIGNFITSWLPEDWRVGLAALGIVGEPVNLSVCHAAGTTLSASYKITNLIPKDLIPICLSNPASPNYTSSDSRVNRAVLNFFNNNGNGTTGWSFYSGLNLS